MIATNLAPKDEYGSLKMSHAFGLNRIQAVNWPLWYSSS